MAEAPLSSAAPPARLNGPPADWKHRALYDRVIRALYALPWEFETDINIVGIRLTDLYTFNSALGAAIEQSVVANLNKLRPVWDPDDEYRLYRFVRQAQVFPDVRLQTGGPGEEQEVIMGIELKGWFAMAKEGEPSFRYTVSPGVCAPQDLLVVYPWILKEVISGSPMLLQPFIEEARFAAETRNHYWRVERGRDGAAAEVVEPPGAHPYPAKGEAYNDVATRDGGGNFGRVSRGGGVMDDFIAQLMTAPVSGIPLLAWQQFVLIFSEGRTSSEVGTRLQQLRGAFPPSAPDEQPLIQRIVEMIAIDYPPPPPAAPAVQRRPRRRD